MKKRHILKTISLIMTLAMLLGVLVSMPVVANDTQSTSTTKVTGDWNPSAGSYVIDSKEDLLAFATLGQTNNFSGKTVYLAADIDLNPGWVASSTAPSTIWTPPAIGGTSEFAGTFDGQGYAVSGVYMTTGAWGNGFFRVIAGSGVIKNFAILNSYFAPSSNSNGSGAFAGLARNGAKFENLYTNAKVNGYRGVGGILGAATHTGSQTFTNCVFAGSVNGQAGVGCILGATQSSSNATNIAATQMTDCVNFGTATTYGDGNGNKDTASAMIGRASDSATLTRCANFTSGLSFIGLVHGGWENQTGLTTNATVSLTNCASLSNTIVTSTSVLTSNISRYTLVVDGTTYSGATQETAIKVASPTVSSATSVLEDTAFSSWSNTLIGVIPNSVADTIDIPTISDGTVSIDNAHQLRLLSATTSNFLGMTVKLTADIDLNPGWTAAVNSHKNNNVPTYGWTPIANFKGTLDGQGHTISGLYVAVDGTYNGMFKKASGATFKNIVITNTFVASANWGGALVGAVTESACSFNNIYVDAIVQAYNADANTRWYLGGLVGAQTAVGASYSNCVFAGTVTYCRESCAAIVGATGKDSETTLTNCINIGTVNATSQSAGLVGRWCGSGTLTNCANIGTSSAVALVTLDSHGDDAQKGTSSDIKIVDSYWLSSKSAAGVTVNANNNLFTFVTVTVNGKSNRIEGNANISSESAGALADTLKISAPTELLSKNGYDAWVAYGDTVMPASVAEMLYGIEEIRMVGSQESEAVDGKFNVRFIGGIDNLNYDYVGFDITLTYGDTSVKLSEEESRTHFVFTSIIADGEPVSATDAKLADLEITHMYVAVVKNIPTTGTATVSARAYAIKDGQRVYTGEAYTITSADGVMAWN